MDSQWGLHPVYQTKYRSWLELEKSISSLTTAKEKGDAFEQLSYFYFVYHRDWYDIEEVWCDKVKGRAIPQSIRKQFHLEKKDYGVDGASRLRSGKLEAWQGKFRSDRSYAPYAELATFWAESEHADSRRIIANSQALPPQAQKKKAHQQTLVDRLLELDEGFFSALHSFATEEREQIERVKFAPLPHQQAMIDDVVSGLAKNDRGKLIAACGVGKTLAALWITEHKQISASRVLILVPSIALVGQTLEKWTMHRNLPFTYLVVCSDETVDSDLEAEDDASDIPPVDLGVSVTTTPEEVTKWLGATASTRQYIFSTYHSANVIEEALKGIPGYRFDLIIFDEAHRTVGRSDQQFAVALHDSRIPAMKRLFMTATERLISPRIVKLAKQGGQEVFSMSDTQVYGPTLHEYAFGSAIRDGIIADYEIVLAEVTGESERELITDNRFVRVAGEKSGQEPIETSAEQLFKCAFLLKGIEQGEVAKVVTFHSKRKNAVAFSRILEFLAIQRDSLASKDSYIGYVLGDQNSAERADRIAQFEQSDIGILCNVHVLSEGVDIPLIDSVYFVDPKTSLIDIIQAIGRALRKPLGSEQKKTAKIIVPILVPPEATSLEDVDWDDVLETFHNVIQSMRDQDARLREEIDDINLYAITRGQMGHRLGSRKGKITVVAPAIRLAEKVEIDAFLQKLTLRIATANGNPDGVSLGFSHLGKGERRSEYKPEFGILGDYNPQPYNESLVKPTIARFGRPNEVAAKRNLQVNHNNVSHTERLGLITSVGRNEAVLTTLGRAMKEGKISFEQVFKNQMLLFSNEPGLYPYRITLSMLIALGELSHIEFLYGPYILRRDKKGNYDIDVAVQRVQWMRTRYPDLQFVNLGNRDTLRQAFNDMSNTEIPDKDVWGDRSTPKNKFRYLKSALSLFDFIDAGNAGYDVPLRLRPGREADARTTLYRSDPAKAPAATFYGEWYWMK